MNFKDYKSDTVGIPEFDKIRNDGRLLIEYVRGSTSYNLQTPDSDIDTGGIYICTMNELLGYNTYNEEISDKKSDNKWYELGTFINLLVKSNPNILEALFVDDEFIIGEIHPIMKYLRDNRDMFLTKQCFNTIFGFANSQIVKARGLNKKIVNPIKERRTPLDFTYTFYKQGSIPIMKFLESYGMKPEYCGLVNIPHMENMYGLYYDWGMHFSDIPNDDFDTFYKLSKSRKELCPHRCSTYLLMTEPIMHYRGLTTEIVSHTTQLRLSSIDDPTDIPICHISFNNSGFQDHCRRYKEYKEWEQNRNPVRYASNLDKNYDSKNMMHSFRLIHMGKEIAEGKGMILKRTWDHDFLMDIRNHKYEYDELISLLDKEKEEMNELMKKSTLPDTIDVKKLNEILIKLRLQQLNQK